MYKLYIQLLSRVLLIIGGMLYTLRFFTEKDPLPNTKSIWVKLLLALIGVAVLINVFDRNFYLPFLGQTVFPPPPLTELTAEESTQLSSVVVPGLPPKTRVIFWASKESDVAFENPMIAYGDYGNVYVTDTDQNGIALAKLKCPGEYAVKKYGIFNKNIPRHVHYRYELPEYKGLFSKVFTQRVGENCE